MKSVPSYTVDRETAAALRDWLFENAVEKHGESDIFEPLTELAAAIDGVLYKEAAAVELGAWVQTDPLAHRNASHADHAPVDEYHRHFTALWRIRGGPSTPCPLPQNRGLVIRNCAEYFNSEADYFVHVFEGVIASGGPPPWSNGGE